MSAGSTTHLPSGPPDEIARDHSFFGHPRGLLTLFGTELWERFSFLAMQAILVLYFADTAANGGLGYDKSTAASMSAAYGTVVYLLSVAGGWLADRVLGSYRSVLVGGVLIAAGHYTMAVPTEAMTWVGLGLIVVGTGLLKPNISSMVGKLYRTDDERRDAGFALYYMGINIGAFLGPLISGWLGQRVGYHWGFSAAAIGMTFAVLQYVHGRRNLAGKQDGAESPLPPARLRRVVTLTGVALGALVVLAVVLAAAGVLTLDRGVFVITVVSMVAPIAYFTVMFRSPRTHPDERRRLRSYIVLFAASVMFNMILFQAYNVLNLLALDHADTSVFGWSFPSSWYASVLPLATIAFSPVIAGLWQRMGAGQPHAAKKIATAVLLAGASFLVLVAATAGRSGDWRMAPFWLLGVYCLMAVGDILLQTTGMSATTKLAPVAFNSQTMALWMLSIALAQGIQAQVVKVYGEIPDAVYFGVTGMVAIVFGVCMMLAAPWLRRTMHPVH